MLRSASRSAECSQEGPRDCALWPGLAAPREPFLRVGTVFPVAAVGPGLVEVPRELNGVLDVYLPVAIAVFVLIVLALVFVVVRFRHRAGDGVVSQRSSAPRLEAAYVAVLAAIVAGLLTYTFRSESRVDALASSPSLRIAATASDWRWRFDYRQLGISQLGRDEETTDLYVPAGETIEFDLTSLDVIHAFYLPDQDFQRQAFPRFVNRFDLVFPRAGVLMSGSCNEFCGIGHATMTFAVHVLSRPAFATWVSAQRTDGG